ncbi:MAG: hypothetical protein NWP80_01320 [Candidatus Gracilibacteria bacterium]|nr:hypothetical protein [Candidatus Gracilibacteria bacterium]
MKNLLKVIFGLSIGLTSLVTSASGIDRFELESTKTTLKTGESMDLTVKAVDKNGAVVTNFIGEVLIFSQTDTGAELPGELANNTFKFEESNKGVIKFENAIKFKKVGINDINVFDSSNPDIFGVLEIDVTDSIISERTEEIQINYPEQGITIGKDNLTVTGSTQKNHKIILLLNNDNKIEAFSNDEGLFSVEIKDLKNGVNNIKAQIMSADDSILGETENVAFTIDSMVPKVKSIKINPEENIFPEDKINIELVSDEDLELVRATIGEQIITLSQSEQKGIYKGDFLAPNTDGNYNINIVLRNEIGVEYKEDNVKELKVLPKELPTAEEPVEVEINCIDFEKELIITNQKVVKMKSKSVISWDKLDKASGYNIYKKDKESGELVLVEQVKENKYEIEIVGDEIIYDEFAIKAVLKDDVCDIESVDYAEMTKVQTGPKEIAIFIIALTLGLALILRRKKA